MKLRSKNERSSYGKDYDKAKEVLKETNKEPANKIIKILAKPEITVK